MFFEAIFEPSEANKNENAQKLAGKRIAVQAGSIVKEGPYKGEHWFYIPNSTVGLIHSSDLREIKPVPIVRWKEIYNSLGLEN